MTSYKKDIEKLTWVDYSLPQRDKNNYVSFIVGFLAGKNDDGFTRHISQYLHQVHQINIEYNTWLEQLDHYTYKQNKNMSLVSGLRALLEEIEEYPGKLIENEVIINEEEIDWDGEPKGEVKEQVQLQNGITIAVGDYFQLTDKIGSDYKRTRFYDASLRAPDWDLFYSSERDFEHIFFYFEVGEQDDNFITFGRLRRLFSDCTIQIESISIKDNKVIVYSDLFAIFIEDAIANNELKILDKNSIKITDFSNLIEKLLTYLQGISEHLTLTEVINKWCFYDLNNLNKPWHNYNQSINGSWYRRNG